MAKTLKSLAPGDTLVVPGSQHNGVAPVLRKLADDHYATDTTLLDTRDIIELIAFDGKEATNSNTNRQSSGNNNYNISNIRQYLNSVGPNWYSPQHNYDAPPSATNTNGGHGSYDNRNGFLSAFPVEFVEHIVTTTLTTVIPNIDGGGTGTSTQNDKVFLLSRTEVGLGNEREVEGKVIPFLRNANSRLRKPTQQALDNTAYTHGNLSATLPWHWWLRSPTATSVYSVRSTNRSGALADNHAIDGYNGGLAPALNLPSDTLVSDAPNEEGHYEIILTPSIEKPKIKIGTEKKEILEIYLRVGDSNKTVVGASILIDGVSKPWL